MPSNLVKRTLVAILGVPAFLLFLCFPAGRHAAFGLFLCGLAYLSGREYQNILKQKWVTVYRLFFPALCAFMVALAWLQSLTGRPLLAAGLFLSFALFFSLQFTKTNFFESLSTVSSYFLGLALIGGGWGALMLLTREDKGLYLVSLLLASIWTGDVLAYLSGLYVFGNKRHKTPLKVSPAKSWEGYAGQLVGSVLGMVLVQLLFSKPWTVSPLAGVLLLSSSGEVFPWALIPLLALFTAFFAAMGDLAESLLKRSVNIKDSGSLLAGHGGVLDRFDSLFFAAPAFYLLMRIFFV